MKKQKYFIIFLLLLLGLGFSIFQYLETFKAEIVSAVAVGTPNPGHTWSSMECNASSLCVDASNNRLGIGTASPSAPLQIGEGTANGTILYRGLILSGGWSSSVTRQQNLITFKATDSVNSNPFSDTSGESFKNFHLGIVSDADYYQGDRFSIIQAGSERLTVSANTGYVGIGSAFGSGSLAPGNSLHIANGANSQLRLSEITGAFYTDIGRDPTDGYLRFDNDQQGYKFLNQGAEAFRITSTGVGIGGITPSYRLQLSTDSAAKPSTNTWTIASDQRIKKDIRNFTDGLSVIEGINPVWYKYNGKANFTADGVDYIGVIAQDIQKVAPYTVSTYSTKLNPTDNTETTLLNFNSHALTFVLINSVKELKAENDALKQLVCLDHPTAEICK